MPDDRTIRPKLVGARIRRVEDPRLLAGRGSYVDDMHPSGMLHLAIRRSDYAHARIAAISTTAAQEAAGVIAVFTGADLATMVQPLRATSRMKDYHATPLWPLAQGKVRYVGEPVVAVVAESRYLAEDALELVEIEYDMLPEVTNPEHALRQDAPLLHEEAGTNVLAVRAFSRGDPDGAIARSPVRVSGRFRMHRKTPLPIENRVYLAEYDRGRRSLTVHSATNIPGLVRDALAEALDMPGNRVRVVAPDVGGSFGGKGSVYPEELLVAALARALECPIKWTGDRLEDLASMSQAFDEIVEAELACDAEGRLTGLRATVIGDVGAGSIYPWTASIEPVQVVSFLPGPYRIADYSGKVRAVTTSKSPTGPYRGVGRPISVFVMESLVDAAARRLGMDPVAFRLRNFVSEEEFPYKAASGIVWDRSSFTECLTEACRVADYEALRREQVAARAAGRWFGIGVASYAELTGIGSRIPVGPGMQLNTGTETATIRIDSTGAVTAAFGVASHGQGLETTLAQIIADELGVRMEDVDIIHGDSATMSYGTGTYASRSAVLAGGAATLASRAVKEKVKRAASHLFEAAVDDIETGNGRVGVAGTDRDMSFRELAQAVYKQVGRFPRNTQEELEATKLYDPYMGTTSSSTHLVAVEIDPETYKVSLRRYIVVEDCGRIINPLIVDGQVHGGVAQGIGAALFEEVIYDESGQLLTASLVDYVIPGACDVPPIDVVHIDTESPSTLGGFRGMGEGGTIGAPAAIASAISDALSPLGVAVTELPMTPERIFRLVKQARTQQEDVA